MRWLVLIVVLGVEGWVVWLVGQAMDSLGLAIWLAIATSFVGGWVLGRARAGLDPNRLMSRMQEPGDPERKMGALLAPFVAGVLLLLPGFITDALGLLLLFPPMRSLLSTLLRRLVMAAVRKRFAGGLPGGPGFDPRQLEEMLSRGARPGAPPGREPIREADFEVMD